MKTSRATLAIVGMLLGSVLLGGVIYLGANRFLGTDTAEAACKTTGTSISVTIHDDAFSERQINGRLCDTLTITNADDKVRNIAFGEHNKHVPYDGVEEKILKKGDSFTVTFDKTGTYEVHDHREEEAGAFFTVTDQ